MKRSAIILGLITLFFAAMIGIAGCGLNPETTTDGLTNAAGSNQNGPGSGNWKPAQPTNERQYKRLHNTLTQLMDRLEQMGVEHVQTVITCYTVEGKRIENNDSPLCEQPIQVLELEANKLMTDFQAGYVAFSTCDCSHLETLKVDLPEKLGGYPLVLQDGVPTVIMPLGVDDDAQDVPWNGYCCLTCTQRLDFPEYAFIDLEVGVSSAETE